MFDTPMIPPKVDQATVDHFVAKGRRMRSKAFVELFRAMFASQEPAITSPTTTRRATV